MRIGLAQLNPTVGDLAGNRRKILEAYAALVAQGAELVVFPELAVCGYPPRDLLFKRRFVSDVADSLAEIAAAVGAVPAVLGTVEANPSGTRTPVLQLRRVLLPGESGRAGPQMPAADLRRLRRGPLLRAGALPDRDRARGRPHRDFTSARTSGRIPMISTRRLYTGRVPIEQLADQKLRPHGEPLGEPLAQQPRNRPPDARRRRRRPGARLPRGLRQCHRRQR
jgi:NAD+ synthase (glutamine-hydrolysing)